MGQLLSGDNRIQIESGPEIFKQENEIQDGVFKQAYGAIFGALGTSNHGFPVPAVLPESVDLRLTMTPYPPVVNQGDVPSCTADAAVAALELTSRRQNVFPLWSLSANYLYYMLLQSTLPKDAVRDAVPGTIDSRIRQSGVSLLDATKQLERGVAPDNAWGPETPWNRTPSVAAQDQARKYRASLGKCVPLLQSLDQLRTVLASGFSILFSFAVTEDGDKWMRTETKQRESNFLFPANWGQADLARIKYAHSALLIGYDDTARHFLTRNSWGDKWANEGHFYLEFDAIVQPFWCRDFFTVLAVVSD